MVPLHRREEKRREEKEAQRMANTKWCSSWLVLAICAAVLVLSWSGRAEAGMEMTWMPSSSFMEVEDEFQFDNEINRRILATTKYISYGALQRNTVPCSRRGASYYNCKPGAQANPYTRGCSAITRCRS